MTNNDAPNKRITKVVNAMLSIVWPVLWVILSGIMEYLGNVTCSGTLLGYILVYGGQLPIAIHLACVLIKRSHYVTTIRETYAVFGDISDSAYKVHLENLRLSAREDDMPACIKNVYDSLGSIIRFSLAQGQLLDSHFNVYKKLKERVPYSKLSESFLTEVITREKKRGYEIFCRVVQNQTQGILETITEESLWDKDGFKQAIKTIKAGFRDLRCEDVSREVAQLSASDDKKEDILFHCIQTIYTEYCNLLAWETEDFTIADKKITIYPFKYLEEDNASEEINALYRDVVKSITQNLKNLSFLKADESIQQFLNYSTKHGYIDHGIASGALLS